jgi:hypothetical protein
VDLRPRLAPGRPRGRKHETSVMGFSGRFRR